MKQRLFAFDALKALSIFLVVMGHVLYFSINSSENLIWQFINVVNMPMFMFISGYFSGSPSAQSIVKRIRTLLLPTFLVGMLFCLCKGISLNSFLTTPMHSGYWFCFTLFCFNLCYWLLHAGALCVGRRLQIREATHNKLIFSMLIGGGILAIVASKLLDFSGAAMSSLSVQQFCMYLPWFFYGIAAKKFERIRNLIIQSNWVFTISFVALSAAIYVGFGYTVTNLIITFAYINVMTYAFNRWFFNARNKVIDYVATRTIDIYLFHYFLLPTCFIAIPETFNPNTNILITLIGVGGISALVMAGTLVFTRFIETSNFLMLVLLGKIKQ